MTDTDAGLEAVEVFVEGHWCILWAATSVRDAAVLNAQPVQHPVLGLVYVVPDAYPLRMHP